MFGFESIVALGAPREIAVELWLKRTIREPIRVNRLYINAPLPGFIIVSAMQWDGQDMFVGGNMDAYLFSIHCRDTLIDVPRITRETRVRAVIHYTGLVPRGYSHGKNYRINVQWHQSEEDEVQRAERVKPKWPRYLRLVKGGLAQ